MLYFPLCIVKDNTSYRVSSKRYKKTKNQILINKCQDESNRAGLL